MHWAEKIISYNNTLSFTSKLPKGISIMNPYAESEEARNASESFYRKYYSDDKPRKLILGINPGRHGAGATGIPFTDPKRLKEIINISWDGELSHEPSSVYIYDMIKAFGTPEEFYSRYFINSVSPLGYTVRNELGKEVNFNYYDSPSLYKRVMPFILSNLEKLRQMGFEMDTAYCLGVKNAKCLEELNTGSKYFRNIIALEHPRYIMQYRIKSKEEFIQKYLDLMR